jgi:hypothetical protein
MPTSTTEPADVQLADEVAACYGDPLRFVRTMYDWPIHDEPGPDTWQRELLEAVGTQVRQRKFTGREPVLPLRFAVSKGHGVGGSTLIAWLIDWIMSTRPHCRGTVTANTNDQLEKKTWAAVREWTKRCLTAHWFEINSNLMYRKGARESWFCAPASCAEENSEAFAGQHAKNSTSFYFNDEDSAVPDKIHEVEEGGLTDGEAMQFLFGNPTRNTGAFYRACFGAQRERYTVRVIDSRTTKFANKALIEEWIADYGLESDFVKVRVRGLPPSTDELTWIGAHLIAQAQVALPQGLRDEPLIVGVDVSGGGNAWTIAAFRSGTDARAIKWVALTGEQTVAHDRQLVIAKLAQILQDYDVAAMNIDTAFGAPIATRLRDMGHRNVFEVSFGAESPDATCANLRAYMYKSVRDWLGRGGCIDQHDHRLATDLGAFGWHLDQKNRLVIESKMSLQRRGVASIDRADALALTFATRVGPKVRRRPVWGAVSQSPFA